jgi:hypothetical protein
MSVMTPLGSPSRLLKGDVSSWQDDQDSDEEPSPQPGGKRRVVELESSDDEHDQVGMGWARSGFPQGDAWPCESEPACTVALSRTQEDASDDEEDVMMDEESEDEEQDQEPDMESSMEVRSKE